MQTTVIVVGLETNYFVWSQDPHAEIFQMLLQDTFCDILGQD